MTADQIILLTIVGSMLGLFLWGRWRHDIVAMAALLVCVLIGLVPAGEAFLGFGHPAVITVGCILVLSHALESSGAINSILRPMLRMAHRPMLSTAVLTGVVAMLSAFINNVGALAIMMPVAIQIAVRTGMPAGKILMPLSFGSMLGGMTTLIGTPPNLIVSSFREASGGNGFAMFDFTPVGLTVALCGVAFVSLFGRWLVPARRRADAEGFVTGAYLTEARVDPKSRAAGMTLRDIDRALEAADAQVIGLVSSESTVPAPSAFRKVQAGDILLIEAEPAGLASALSDLGLRLEESIQPPSGSRDEASASGDANKPGQTTRRSRAAVASADVALMEYVVLPDSALVGRTASDLLLRTRFAINLLAISRQGHRSITRLRTTSVAPGDVLLLQGQDETLREFAHQYGCVPLAERPLRMPDSRKAVLSAGIILSSVGLASTGLVAPAVAFALGVLAVVVLKAAPLRTVYDSIDWSVIVLIAALLPLAGAIEATGAADLITRQMLGPIAGSEPLIALFIILVATMALSDLMNNAATATVMCPVALSAAEHLAANPEPFLMAVAIGASCAFLTPIGHQNNALILGPGGFRFGDYWRLGLPLECLIAIVAIPMIVLIWPIY